MRREDLDAWLPTLARYVGLVLAVAIVVAEIFGKGGNELASAGVLALGMMLFKNFKGGAEQ